MGQKERKIKKIIYKIRNQGLRNIANDASLMLLYLAAQKAPLTPGLGVVNKLLELLRVPLPIEGVTMIGGWASATSFSLLLANASPVGGGRLMMGI